VAGRAEDTPPPEQSTNGDRPLRIGVLAIQGDFEAHSAALRRLGAAPVEVRRPGQLAGLDGLVIPGGESTTITMGLDAYGLEQPIKHFVAGGGAIFGTCAGLIVLDRGHLGLIDIEARRNAFGRQLHSFEADIPIRGLGDEPLRAVFIRAPWIESAGDAVDVLAEVDGHPVVARQRNILVAAFHPELTDDLRLHAYFLALAGESKRRCVRDPAGLPADGPVS
jgi:pyridoxal 5'-phosphate synthase pdxT subunit